MTDKKEFWLVVCDNHPETPFVSGMRPFGAFRIEVEQAAREYCAAIRSTNKTAILIKVVDDIPSVVSN